ncbi:hypothetical protein [Cytobacillus kochii]|uniref:Uncharacterized protein n=1 Tax=Cytobacillus kochii TaxID=859143 RepID=A0A248TGF8_9BACI|nr:hypothetical protein [Cytobacillus kochii]ASV67219.1 hypothetical protein CKF48_07680 [Cytobacillus kochii]
MANNQLEIFWEIYRRNLGFNPDEPMGFQERSYWKRVRTQMKKCMESNDPEYALYNSPDFNKQYFLSKWWDKLDRFDKEKYLIHVWLNKGVSLLHGYDWWLPYFKDIGFISNCNSPKPNEDILLYRGAYPAFSQGLSWTPNREFAKTFAGQGEKMNVYQVVVKPESILGIFSGTAGYIGEPNQIYHGFEYVVDYRTIEPKIVRR